MDSNYRTDRPLGYQQITGAATVKSLTVPAGAILAIVQVETQAVRWRDDATDPTALIGYPLPVGAELVYTGQLGLLKFFEQAPTTTINVCYYGFPT